MWDILMLIWLGLLTMTVAETRYQNRKHRQAYASDKKAEQARHELLAKKAERADRNAAVARLTADKDMLTRAENAVSGLKEKVVRVSDAGPT